MDENENSPYNALQEYFLAVNLAPIRMLMKAGYSAADAADLIRQGFVNAFYETPEFWRQDQPSALQCSVKTGLSRRVISELTGKQTRAKPKRNRAARVLFGWINDPDFHNEGKADQLQRERPDHKSFRGLVARYAADARPDPVLHDLEHAGCIRIEGNTVHLINPTYGMDGIENEKWELSGYMANRLGDTTEHNLTSTDPQARRLKRIWWQPRIPTHKIREAQNIIHTIGQRAGREIDQALAKLAEKESDVEQSSSEVGVVIFGFQR